MLPSIQGINFRRTSSFHTHPGAREQPPTNRLREPLIPGATPPGAEPLRIELDDLHQLLWDVVGRRAPTSQGRGARAKTGGEAEIARMERAQICENESLGCELGVMSCWEVGGKAEAQCFLMQLQIRGENERAGTNHYRHVSSIKLG